MSDVHMAVRRTCPLLRRVGAVLTLIWVSLLAGSASADVFHLDGGGRVEGQLIASEAGQYEIRTVVGVVKIPMAAVKRIEESPSPFEEYDRRAKDAADNAAAQTELAEWCAEAGLRAESRRHLLRAIELDRDFAPAHRALGQVYVGGLWVDGARVVKRAGKAAATGAEPADEQRLAQAIQAEWRGRVRAIRKSLLEARTQRLVADGRAQISAIVDPLAILPLSEELSRGNVACRLLLVDSLAKFNQDEATMNLAIMALIDRADDVRTRALAELIRRQDPRVAAQYRAALRRGDDVIAARAAEGLGALNAVEAVPDLIAALTVQRTRWVEVPVREYIGSWPQAFTKATIVHIGGALEVVHLPIVGVCYDEWSRGYDVRNEWRLRRVKVYRTEVLEALKRLTGQNFGFDRERWRRWYQAR